MKVSFHYNADDPNLGICYGYEIENHCFRVLLDHRSLNVQSKVFLGDLLLHEYASDVEKRGSSTVHRFNRDRFLQLFDKWLHPDAVVWSRLLQERAEIALNSNIYVLCFESIDLHLAEYLNQGLADYAPYLGAIEVDDASATHWMLYSQSLVPQYRILNRDINIFFDPFTDDRPTGLAEDLRILGFRQVAFESLNGKYSIFDEYNNFEQARRVAEWKRRGGSLLAFVADDVVARLGDTAPELGNKLWAALDTFERAETAEQLAQVAASCRRIIEYVTDSLFPPVEGEINEHKVGKAKHLNRLWAYVDREKLNNTNIALIRESSEVLMGQIKKLLDLANKGIHDEETYRGESRRCLIRTILLLDDLASLKREPFEINPKIDFGPVLKDLL